MANCPSCSAEVAPGTRWCGICRTNVLNPRIGRLASPGKRLGAYFLDLLVTLVVLVLFLIFGVVGDGAATGTEGGTGVGVLLGNVLFLGYIVWAFMLFAKGMTPGKKLLGMRVIKEDGTSAGFFTMLIREWIGKAISGLILSLGFLWILFDRDKQGWHDKLMSTYVVE
jgi:uncharacterized RDD family membrane protein YckC